MNAKGQEEYSIVFYDGECGFCQKAVQFILPRDNKERFRFVAMQSDKGRSLLAAHGLNPEGLNTFVLQDEGKLYTKSSAGLRVLRGLGGGWKLLYSLIAIPKPLRDAVYSFIARNRYRWFGRAEACRLPQPHERRRFLE